MNPWCFRTKQVPIDLIYDHQYSTKVRAYYLCWCNNADAGRNNTSESVSFIMNDETIEDWKSSKKRCWILNDQVDLRLVIIISIKIIYIVQFTIGSMRSFQFCIHVLMIQVTCFSYQYQYSIVHHLVGNIRIDVNSLWFNCPSTQLPIMWPSAFQTSFK